MTPIGSDRISLHGEIPNVAIGAFRGERSIPQLVRFELELAVQLYAARFSDDLADTVDYADVYERMRKLATRRSFALLEHCANTLLTEIVRTPGVLQATLRLMKPAVFAHAEPAVRISARPPTIVALGLGANIGDVRQTLAAAVRQLAGLGAITAVSGLYESAPWGGIAQPHFTNAALVLETMLLPRDVLGAVKHIEVKLGRMPGVRWGPRVLDIDILDDDGGSIADADLIIPHPRLAERAFALVPLAEIASRYESALDALSAEERASVVRVAEWPTWGANPGEQ